MKRFAIIENGAVTNIVVAEESMDAGWIQNPPASVSVGWNYGGGKFVAPDKKSPTSVKITKLAFRNRFTFSEKVLIETAAEGDATVRVLLKDQEAATFIDLARLDTQQGVQLLVSKNLITAERSDAILSISIQPEEAFNG